MGGGRDGGDWDRGICDWVYGGLAVRSFTTPKNTIFADILLAQF